MASTFDEEQIIQSITYKCITRLDQYNELSAYKIMPLLNYCPPTCLITSVVVRNSYYLEYVLVFNEQPIIPRTVVVNDNNIWFNSIIPSLAQFWEDVEQARQGAFILPEGRKMRAKSACLIQDDIEPKSSTKRNYNFMVIDNNIDDHNDEEPILSVDA